MVIHDSSICGRDHLLSNKDKGGPFWHNDLGVGPVILQPRSFVYILPMRV